MCTTACCRERGEANGGCRADVLPTSYQSPDPGNAEEIQQRKASHFQHLPVLPQGETAVFSMKLNSTDKLVCVVMIVATY